MSKFLIEYGTLIAIFISPIVAVLITVWYQNRGEKRKIKLDLFLTLFAYRGSPVHVKFVDALNQIDIVFLDSPKVLQAWHSYLSALGQKGLVTPDRTWEILRVELLSNMAVAVGYSALNQTDILKSYYPEGHENFLKEDIDLREAALTFLRSSAAINEMNIQKSEASKKEG